MNLNWTKYKVITIPDCVNLVTTYLEHFSGKPLELWLCFISNNGSFSPYRWTFSSNCRAFWTSPDVSCCNKCSCFTLLMATWNQGSTLSKQCYRVFRNHHSFMVHRRGEVGLCPLLISVNVYKISDLAMFKSHSNFSAVSKTKKKVNLDRHFICVWID